MEFRWIVFLTLWTILSGPMLVRPTSTQARAPQKAEPKAARTYREGKKLVSAHVPQEVHRELRLMAIEDDSDLQHLIEEAIDLLFVKKGKPPMFRHA